MSDIKQQQQQAQQAAQQQAAAQQQQMEQQQQQTIQVQLAHDASQQLHAQAQVVSSGASMIPTSTLVMSAPQTMLQQNMQSHTAIAPMPSHSASPTFTTMGQPGAQSMADWGGHSRVQVIQQPLQNPTYVQQVYNPQGQLLIPPGNIALHSGMNQGSIQVIAAGKPFQSGQMQHMLTTQGKPLVQGQTASFPGYATIPTSGNNQTLVISPLGVQHLLPQQQQQATQQQKQEMQKVHTNGNNAGMKVASSQSQNVSITSQQQAITSQAPTLIQPQIISPIQYTQQQRTIPQGATQTMQFAPWQFQTGLPQGLTWTPGATAIQSPAGTATLLAQGNQIFIRGPQPDQGMFHIHNTAQATLPAHTSMQAQPMAKTQQVEMQPKAAIPKTFSNILPNSPQQIRPCVSTQTGQTQTHIQQNLQQKSQPKVRTKTMLNRTMPSIASQKSDAANQTKGNVNSQNLQPKMNGNQQILIQQDKMLRVQSQAQVQQLQLQQQQMHMFQQQLQGKATSTGQIMMSNAIQGQLVAQTGSDRPVMPVVSMQPGVQTPLMTPMVVQSVDQVQGYSQGVQMIAPPITVKTEDNLMKEEGSLPVGDVVSGPGRPDDESAPSDNDLNSQGSTDGVPPNQDPSTEHPPSTGATTDLKQVAKDKENDRTGVEKAQPPKAMVKPQVLTHVIEGFVIQEASEPFAVNRGVMDGLPKSSSVSDEPPRKKALIEAQPETATSDKMGKCEMCGKVDLKSKFKASQRFCSLSCAKSSRVGLFKEGDNAKQEMEVPNSTGDSRNPPEKATAPLPSEEDVPKVNPLKWTVSDVCEFIRSLPGCAEYVEDFAFQEIDGQALMLLKEDHLMSAMSIKLGPALKIVSKLNTMRVDPPEGNPAS